MRLSDYLSEDLVIHGLGAGNLSEVLTTIGDHFEKAGFVPSADDATAALMTREESHTTCLGHGVALPHATVPGLTKPVLMVATATEPVQFGHPESEPVDLFFVLLSPPGREGEHIKLLARICRLGQRPEDLAEIRKAPDKGSLFQAVLRLDSRHV
jgi:mannitol/fructose-specific phosphotransferase system IIA component (Ntr-type)